MHTQDITPYCHSHVVQADHAGHERRTWWVVGLTGPTMIVEIAAGYATGSMALLADGWHMATHVGALGLAGLAYWFARRQAKSGRFSFGTGKVYALAGYTNAILLGVAALWIAAESIQRLRRPAPIEFGSALLVAGIGLAVNVVSALLLGLGHHHDHAHDDDHEHEHAPADHNLRAAYLHVLADALTSVLAIVALLGGYFLHWTFLDPAMGLIGAAVIVRWGWGLCRQAAGALLDITPSGELSTAIRKAVESVDDSRVCDLHLWEISPGRFGCIVSLVASQPRETEVYRQKVLQAARIAHLTVEVTRCATDHAPVNAA
ncbi:MAG: CDF family Co(II)/Ni(II) efflux transporter DmeF [Planctomycetes bacterium]|nr:CDF family Co(II)/Ni(II) efflux transporter DmeF [Planctomycetota bacterium]